MRRYSPHILQTYPSIWTSLTLGIVATSILYAILRSLGISQDITIVVSLGCLLILLVVSLFLTYRNKSKVHHSDSLLIADLGISNVLAWLYGSRLERWLSLATIFSARSITKGNFGNDQYLAFQFKSEGIETEHAGAVIYYVDLARLFDGHSYSELDTICALMARDIERRELKFDCLVGLPHIGSHIGVVLAERLRKPYAIVAKERGVSVVSTPGDLVEGYALKPEETVMLFDDAIVSGTSILDAVKGLRSVGVKVIYAYTFLDKEHGGTELIKREGVQVFSLLQGRKLATVLRASGVLSAMQVDEIFEEATQAKERRLSVS